MIILELFAGRAAWCATAAAGALLLSSCGLSSNPAAAPNRPATTATTPAPFSSPTTSKAVPKRVKPVVRVPKPKPVVRVPKPKPVVRVPKPVARQRARAPRPVVRRLAPKPKPRPAPIAEPVGNPFLSNFTCKPDGDKWLISYTLHRPPDAPVPVKAYKVNGGAMFLGSVKFHDVWYKVNKGFSHECGRL